MADEVAFQHGDGNAVSIDQLVSGCGAQPFAGSDDAREVHRIGRSDGHEMTIRGRTPDFAKALDGIGQGELLT